MTRYGDDLMEEFLSAENRDQLLRALTAYFNDSVLTEFDRQHFSGLIYRFSETLRIEFSTSDPLVGSTLYDQLVCLNNQFISVAINFIKDAHAKETVCSPYTVTDGAPTSRKSIKQYYSTPNETLAGWLKNSGRPVQMRDARDGDEGKSTYDGRDFPGVVTGITFCDQSELGTSQHYAQLFGGDGTGGGGKSYMELMNKSRPHELVPFGVSTPASDARLLSRRTFRKNEEGVENGIPRYERRLQRRALDRDVREGMRADGELGYIQQKYDMRGLYGLMDYKNVTKNRFNPCMRDPQTQLQNNNSRWY